MSSERPLSFTLFGYKFATEIYKVTEQKRLYPGSQELIKYLMNFYMHNLEKSRGNSGFDSRTNAAMVTNLEENKRVP